MPFRPVDPDLDLPDLEARVMARWAEGDVEERVRAARSDGEPWVFYEGPPTANGRPGLHHVWARAFKDLYPRFHTMRGRNVPRKGGWDCHGLPVELEVEKELGLSSKHEIEEFGIAEFNQRCRESVARYVGDFVDLTARSGIWIDTADAYWTLDNDYIESVWWLVRQLWDRELLYEGHRVVPYCARCGTALSSHELGQPDVYREVVDPSVYVRFPLVDDDADLLVWTTTPWTLPSNVAVAAGESITYVRVPAPVMDAEGRDLIVAASRLPEGVDPEEFPSLTGDELVGRRYRRPFEQLPLDGSPSGTDTPSAALTVLGANFVTTDDGSGLVHLAPAFGEDDAAVGRRHSLPVLNPVDPQGRFVEGLPWAGTFVKDADEAIVADLAERGLLVREVAFEHSYPHCWRCRTPLIYWAKNSWFVRTSDRRDVLMGENEQVDWHPEYIKHGRFGKWLEGNVDWALSRDRYWGTPLPVWRCESCGRDECIGSVSELSERAARELTDLDLHRPAVDEITLPCECGGTARRLEPVLDAWFDSGSMPSAQHHHPFAEDDRFTHQFPADFICEAIDQTRGWFYSLLAVNSLVFDAAPYRTVVCLNLLVDEDGQKMAKSRGNVIDPWEIFDTLGADALRWYFFSQGQPWTPRRVYRDAIAESSRQTLLTLWNCYSFFTTYAALDGWTPAAAPQGAPVHVIDRWVLGELDDTIDAVTAALESFDAYTGATRLARFVDDLSNWYVRRSRPRFWRNSDPAAHATLHECLATVAQLLAPFCPFLADELWTGLTDGDSVHLTDWPVASGRADAALSESMAAARRVVALGRAARTDAKIRVRQPLARAHLLHPGVEISDELGDEIRAELNVHELEQIDTLSGLMRWTVVPNFKALGPRLGSKVNQIKQSLAAADGTALANALDEHGFIEVDGERLEASDLEVRAERHEAFALAEEDGWAVALDLAIDDDLRAEGRARELVRAVNELRKEAGFHVADRIRLTIERTEASAPVLDAHLDHVARETLATSVVEGSGDTVVDLDGHAVSVAVVKDQ